MAGLCISMEMINERRCLLYQKGKKMSSSRWVRCEIYRKTIALGIEENLRCSSTPNATKRYTKGKKL